MKKILIVDTITKYIEKERSILNRSDFRIFSATTSEEALNLHRTEQADLIIIDLDMPGITGDRLSSTIKNDPRLRNVFIIIVCSESPSDMERFRTSMADSYITKPVKPLVLLEKVSRIFDAPQRQNYRVLLKVSVKGEKRGQSFFCSSQDISATGMMIETEKALEKGDLISCSFFLPNSSSLFADAEVMRTRKNENGQFQYGVRFIDLKQQYKAAIEQFISTRANKK